MKTETNQSVLDPMVSVIVTAYNSGGFLVDTLASVFAQSHLNHEVIVVDDGSAKERSEFIESTCSQFEGVRLIRQNNQGLSAARNIGAEHSRGGYLAFLDHDDLWAPNFLERLMAVFSMGSRIGVSYCRVEHMTSGGRMTGRVSKPKLRNLQVKDFLVSDPLCCGSSFVIKREAFESVKGFDPEFIRAETPEIAVRLLLGGWEFRGVDDVLVRYRNSPGGLTTGNLLKEYRLRGLRKAIRLCPELGPEFKYTFLIWLNQLRIKLRRIRVA